MILTRAIEQGWRERADLHASLMVPSALLLALLDAVKAGRVMADTVDKIDPESMSRASSSSRFCRSTVSTRSPRREMTSSGQIF